MAKWTNEQRRAIDAAGDILVSAGAGSGKTAVLTERIVRLVREGLGVKELLCVTFTNAAAGEMKKRIERALVEASLHAPDEAEAARLNEAARESASASISTLHSFCTQILRRHFNEAGLDPDFRVADESETALAREEVWDELCEARLSSESAAFASLLEALGSDGAAFEAVSQLYDFCRSLPDPEAFLDLAEAKYHADADELEASEEAQELLSRTRRVVLAKAAALARARDALAGEHPGPAAFIDEEIMHARMVAMQRTPALLREALATKPHPEKGRINWRGCPDGLKKPADDARAKLRDALADEAKSWLRGMEYEAALIARQQPLVAELCAAVRDFSLRFAEYKRAKSVIDYGDMEQLSLALLRDERIALEYRRRFRYVFMDEYQDCNAVQEEIVRALANPGALFLVGDVKQSIYRFRSAEPGLFIRRYRAYRDPAQGCRIDLNANFRSSSGVIGAVNAVFARLMREEVAELEYDASAALVHGREEHGEDASPAVEFAFADLIAEFPEEERESDEDAEAQEEGGAPLEDEEPRGVAALEASLAAGRIRAIMETAELYDPQAGGMRKPRYSDFAILLRSYKNAAEDWLSALSLEGIPAYGELAGGFFDAVEVRVFMDLMRVVDNRLQDIPLAAVLRSPIGGFSTEELIEMRTLYGKEASSASPWRCFDSLTAASKTDMDLGMKAKAFLERLSAWQELAGLTSVQALIARLLDDTDYALFCRALPGGRQREANLDALCEKARLFEATGASGLSAFLQYADKLRAMGAPGAAQSAGADVVRVMSIHASKGLEFPYVLVAGLARAFNIDSGRKRLILDARFGAAARFTLAGVRTQSLYARAIASRDERKSIAEEMRVLYVAMTRAREKLVLLCAAPRGDRLVTRAALPQEPACIAQQKSFAEWLLGCILHAREGEALRRRYGLPEPDGAESLPVAVSCEPLFASLLPGARMGEAAFERFRRHALSLGPDDALFSRAYAYCAEAEVPSKVSVTGLAGHEVKLAEAPDFLLAARMTPTDRGTAYHLLMQRIALAPHGEDGVRAELARLAGAGLLSALQAEAVSPREIAAFFASPLGRRLVAAKTVRRETEFNISMSARALGLADNDASVVLQGVIDCCFLENGRWTLVDYKTDSVPEGVSTHQAAQKHAHQVNLYAEALARLTGIPVAERYVYFFTKNQAVALSEDD